MNYKLGKKSRTRLVGVHPDLILLLGTAIQITPVDFTVLEGLRTKERQARLLEEKKTTTMNSRHLTGDAVDIGALIDGKISWDWQYYEDIYGAVCEASRQLGIEFEWGGNWKSFKDGVHYQRPWR